MHEKVMKVINQIERDKHVDLVEGQWMIAKLCAFQVNLNAGRVKMPESISGLMDIAGYYPPVRPAKATPPRRRRSKN
jgi:hypothetical protein